jgi:hypothetical protein
VDIKNTKIRAKTTSYGLKKMQGLNCKGLKRNWAETKEKGLNRKVLSQWEDIFVNTGKLRGFSAKTPGPAGVDLVDSG